MKRIIAVGFAALLVVTIMAPHSFAVTVTGGIASIDSNVFTGAENSAIFIYPDTAGGAPRCTVSAAIYSDWVAGGMIFGLTEKYQYETRDDVIVAPLFVTASPSCGPGTSSKVILPFGGPLVNNIVHYYEAVSGDSPVYFTQSGGFDKFIKRSDGSTIASLAVGSVGGSTDYFLIETLTDPSGNTVYIFYGFAFTGTSAAAHKMLDFVQTNKLGSQTSAWQVWSWFDYNGDGIVNNPSTDTYTFIASG